MTIAGQNFEVFQGDNKIIIITVKNQDGTLTDLTGYSAVWCVHTFNPNHEIILQKTTLPGEGITIPNPTSGEIVITLTQADTQTKIPKTYGHQCEVEDGLGNHATVSTGYMNVRESITHPSL